MPIRVLFHKPFQQLGQTFARLTQEPGAMLAKRAHGEKLTVRERRAAKKAMRSQLTLETAPQVLQRLNGLLPLTAYVCSAGYSN